MRIILLILSLLALLASGLWYVYVGSMACAFSRGRDCGLANLFSLQGEDFVFVALPLLSSLTLTICVVVFGFILPALKNNAVSRD